MILSWSRLVEAVEGQGAAALVRVQDVRGSAPREVGATMVVRPDGGFWGTIGGGTLEHEALSQARELLQRGRGPALRRAWPLGPDLGQCCGGHVATVTETFDAADLPDLRELAAREREPGGFAVVASIGPAGRVERRAGRVKAGGWMERHGDDRRPLLLFGAGHVGRALAIALAPLPVAVTWFDSRPEAFPAAIPANASPRLLGEPADALASAPPGAAVVVMTHSHPLDLAVVAAALSRDDLGPVGLIGSQTKRARFLARLRDAGLGAAAAQRLVCPIGVPGIEGKEPAVIAAAVAAQVLQWRDVQLRESQRRDMQWSEASGDSPGIAASPAPVRGPSIRERGAKPPRPRPGQRRAGGR
jgi:xanthine dehydrogenase accessory factor